MGIARLADVIKEEAPDAVSLFPLRQYRDRVVALDASIAIYQFRTAMPKLFNRNGENISHLQGLFYRTLHLLENGIKPVFVFDGQPPGLKQPLLARRAEAAGARRDAAESRRAENLPRPLKQDCETLLSYLGVPYVQAPAEAEATCAALVKCGKAWCTATEDMDALPFGSLRLIRHLSAKNSCEVEEFSLPGILQKLGMTQEQIWRLGPKNALKLLQQHGTIEQVLQNIDPQKHPLPVNWDPEGARRLFLQPEVADPGQITLEWRDPDPEGLVRFLAHEKHMNEARVCRRLQRWQDAQPKQRVSGEGGMQRKLGEFFPASKRARPPEVPSPRPSRKRQKPQAEMPREAGSPELGN
ncbi:flap endonuclease 1-like isoform 2-T2 [Pangshura tecta]